MKLSFKRQSKQYYINASEYYYGYLCQKVVAVLLDKENINRNFVYPNNTIHIKNINQVMFNKKDKEKKMFITHYTNHPGGLRKISIHEYKKKGMMSHCLRKSIMGMLPKTKHYKKLNIQNIKFNNE